MKVSSKVLIALFFLPLVSSGQSTLIKNTSSTNTFFIDGHIEGLKDGEKVLLSRFGVGFDNTIVDSSFVRAGTFHFHSKTPDGPYIHHISFSEHQNKFIALPIENGDDIKIESDRSIDEMPTNIIQFYLDINGSRITRDFLDFFWSVRLHINDIGLVSSKIAKLGNYDGANVPLIDAYMEIKKQLIKSWEYLLLDTDWHNRFIPISLLTIPGLKSEHLSILPKIYDLLTDIDKIAFFGRLLKEESFLAIGQPFPVFELPNPEGKKINSKEIFANSKATIIQFWSNNSYKVDEMQKELIDVYQKYHKQGLNIVGMSSDTSEKKWKIGCVDLPWYNVTDLKGENGVVQNVYHEYGRRGKPNTTNVIVDKNGKIVAWDVSGAELQYYIKNILEQKDIN
jgi:peroxiredoxin